MDYVTINLLYNVISSITKSCLLLKDIVHMVTNKWLCLNFYAI